MSRLRVTSRPDNDSGGLFSAATPVTDSTTDPKQMTYIRKLLPVKQRVVIARGLTFTAILPAGADEP